MTLVAVGRRRGEPPVTPVAPYNAATYLSTPTPDSTGSAVHPSVVDMLTARGSAWHGYRYWMAMTPYYLSNDDIENPCILASNDGTTWAIPDGLTNPIDPWRGVAGTYNSDPELVYDPDTDKLVCYWRDYLGGESVPGNLVFCYSESSDGVTWTAQADALTLTYPDSGGIFSPAIIRMGPGDWRMWCVGNPGASQVRTATSYAGPWSAPTNLTINGSVDAGIVQGLWHWGIVRVGGKLYGLVSAKRGAVTPSIYAITSTDGIAWTLNPTPVLSTTAGWDQEMYRPTLTVDTYSNAHVWYSALGAASWRIGRTQVPLTEWPAPPA